MYRCVYPGLYNVIHLSLLCSATIEFNCAGDVYDQMKGCWGWAGNTMQHLNTAQHWWMEENWGWVKMIEDRTDLWSGFETHLSSLWCRALLLVTHCYNLKNIWFYYWSWSHKILIWSLSSLHKRCWRFWGEIFSVFVSSTIRLLDLSHKLSVSADHL